MKRLLRPITEGFREALRFNAPPWRLALALAVGVFISFTPFYGFQTLLSVGIAVAFGLNRAVTVAGAWINLPWFAPLVYAGAIRLGSLILPDLEGLAGLSLSLLLGTTILGTAAAMVTYVVAFGAIRGLRARRAGRGPTQTPGTGGAEG